MAFLKRLQVQWRRGSTIAAAADVAAASQVAWRAGAVAHCCSSLLEHGQAGTPLRASPPPRNRAGYQPSGPFHGRGCQRRVFAHSDAIF